MFSLVGAIMAIYGLITASDAEIYNSPKPASPSPRESSKLSQVMLMLSQESGVTVQEISKAMGWLPHTTRAI
jgi:hypothetical protein